MPNCKEGRSGDQCSLYGEPLSQGTNVVRKRRDPRRGFDDGDPVKVHGVTAIDGMQPFNAHPSGGKWDELKLHLDAGKDFSRLTIDKLMAFVDCARGSENRAVAMDFTSHHSCVKAATRRYVFGFPFRGWYNPCLWFWFSFVFCANKISTHRLNLRFRFGRGVARFF